VKEKKRKKETSAVKYNTSGHYCGRRYKKLKHTKHKWMVTYANYIKAKIVKKKNHHNAVNHNTNDGRRHMCLCPLSISKSLTLLIWLCKIIYVALWSISGSGNVRYKIVQNLLV